MRSPRISSCAPTGVARFFRRAMWPSKASSAIVVTVSTTAARFAHGPRPNKLTAANPTATRKAVTLFGVHCIAISSNLPGAFKCTRETHRRQPARRALFKAFATRHLQTSVPCNVHQHVGKTQHLSPLPCRKYGMQPLAQCEVAVAGLRANAWRAFPVFVGELGSSSDRQNQLVKLE